jgi:hypothetical protein
MYTTFDSEDVKGRNHLENQDVEGRIIFRQLLK